MKTKKPNKMFEVEEIKDKKQFKDGMKYLIKWEGFSTKDNTWFFYLINLKCMKGAH